MTNLSARWIIRYAYRLRDDQVVGAPAWTERRYQIDAAVGNAAATHEELRGMLQRLLVDRFALRARREQLGLTLDATRAPYDVLVIESISPPTPN